jgi:hypothetical protein
MRDELRKVLQDLHGYEVPLTGEVTLDADLDYQNKLTSNEIETALTSIINLVDKELKGLKQMTSVAVVVDPHDLSKGQVGNIPIQNTYNQARLRNSPFSILVMYLP